MMMMTASRVRQMFAPQRERERERDGHEANRRDGNKNLVV